MIAWSVEPTYIYTNAIHMHRYNFFLWCFPRPLLQFSVSFFLSIFSVSSVHEKCFVWIESGDWLSHCSIILPLYITQSIISFILYALKFVLGHFSSVFWNLKQSTSPFLIIKILFLYIPCLLLLYVILSLNDTDPVQLEKFNVYADYDHCCLQVTLRFVNVP